MSTVIVSLKDVSFKTPTLTGVVKFDKGFNTKLERVIDKGNRLTANNIVKYSKAYIPYDTGKLADSGRVVRNSGEYQVNYLVDYASYAYTPRKTATKTVGKRGPLWFDRMWSDYKKSILEETYNVIRREL